MNGTNYEVPHCEVFFTPHSHPSWPKYSPQTPRPGELVLVVILIIIITHYQLKLTDVLYHIVWY